MTTALLLGRPDFERLSRLVQNARTDAADALEQELSRAQVVPPEQLPTQVVTMDSTVTFEDESGKRSTVKLVYPEYANFGEGRVSILAPVGIALIGLQVGQTIEWSMPSGMTRVLKVVEVQPPENKEA